MGQRWGRSGDVPADVEVRYLTKEVEYLYARLEYVGHLLDMARGRAEAQGLMLADYDEELADYDDVPFADEGAGTPYPEDEVAGDEVVVARHEMDSPDGRSDTDLEMFGLVSAIEQIEFEELDEHGYARVDDDDGGEGDDDGGGDADAGGDTGAPGGRELDYGEYGG